MLSDPHNIVMDMKNIMRDESYPIMFVWTKDDKNKNERQMKKNISPSYSKHCSYTFVYVYMFVQSHL